MTMSVRPIELPLQEVLEQEKTKLREDGDEAEETFQDDKDKPKIEFYQQTSYAKKKSVAQRMMDIALLTSNANQLRYVLAFGAGTPYYYVSIALICLSLILQLMVGLYLVFYSKPRTREEKENANSVTIGGVLVITIINVLITAFTIEGEAMKDKGLQSSQQVSQGS